MFPHRSRGVSFMLFFFFYRKFCLEVWDSVLMNGGGLVRSTVISNFLNHTKFQILLLRNWLKKSKIYIIGLSCLLRKLFWYIFMQFGRNSPNLIQFWELTQNYVSVLSLTSLP